MADSRRANKRKEKKKYAPEDGMVLLTLLQITLSDPFVRALRFWRTEIREGMSLEEFESSFSKNSEGYDHFFNIVIFWETVGSLMRRGLVSEDLAFDTFLDAPPWKVVERIMTDRRARDKAPLEAKNFEWIAQRAKEWISKREKEIHLSGD